MRLLVTSYPLLGHLNPVLPLALAARRAGHEVAVATGPDLVEPVERRGLTAWPVGPTHAEATAAPGQWFVSSAAPRAEDLVPRAREWRPDVVVADEFEAAGPVAAAACGARLLVHGLGLMIPVELWTQLRVEDALAALHERWGTPAGARDLRAAPYLEACPPGLRPHGERIWSRTLPLQPVAGLPEPGGPSRRRRRPAAPAHGAPHPGRAMPITNGRLRDDDRH